MTSSDGYIKHVYWLTGEEEAELRKYLESLRIGIRQAKGVVCTPLDEINKISVVPPPVWNDTCARQGSWYRASDKNGLYLVVSSFDLDIHQQRKAATITRTGFRPPRLATLAEKKEMMTDQESSAIIPPEWSIVRDVEKRVFIRWAQRLGSDVEDYDFLYLSQTANHVNFVKPRLFVEEEGIAIPYSIDVSAHLCSCCVELFQILGQGFRKKLVAPCPGATIFARMRPDEYLLVEDRSLVS